MNRSIIAGAAAILVGLSAAHADAQLLQFNPGLLVLSNFVCKRADKTTCTSSDLADPYKKQLVFVAAGFQSTDRAAFLAKFERAIDLMTTAGTTWSTQKKNQLLFVGDFTAGGALGASDAKFGAKVSHHPVRGAYLHLREADVYAEMSRLSSERGVRPFAVAALFNTSVDAPNVHASAPTMAGRYGIARLTLPDVDAGPYALTHELARAGLNFAPEYALAGREDQSLASLDVLTSLLRADATWGTLPAGVSDLTAVYSIRLSEILADNGYGNIATSSSPTTAGYTPLQLAYEGGVGFGRGVWHGRGLSLMGGNVVVRGADDGFAFAHSAAQQLDIDSAFGMWSFPARRANDRLRSLGPASWPQSWGSTTQVLLRDADKNHAIHPTTNYEIMVGWYERVWSTCWWGAYPYACSSDHWKTAVTTKTPVQLTADLRVDSRMSTALQNALCELGVADSNVSVGSSEFCAQELSAIPDAFLPTVKLRLPYQRVPLPASRWDTTYYWTFRTSNGTSSSGWSAWSTVHRTL